MGVDNGIPKTQRSLLVPEQFLNELMLELLREWCEINKLQENEEFWQKFNETTSDSGVGIGTVCCVIDIKVLLVTQNSQIDMERES